MGTLAVKGLIPLMLFCNSFLNKSILTALTGSFTRTLKAWPPFFLLALAHTSLFRSFGFSHVYRKASVKSARVLFKFFLHISFFYQLLGCLVTGLGFIAWLITSLGFKPENFRFMANGYPTVPLSLPNKASACLGEGDVYISYILFYCIFIVRRASVRTPALFRYSLNCALKFLNQFRRNALKNQFEKRSNPSKRCTNSILLNVE